MSSIGSSASTIVSFRGDDECSLDEALDQLYKEIQQNLNHSQCSIRQLAASSEQDDDYIIAVKIQFELDDYIIVLLDLFKELQQVSIQCLGKPPPGHKVEYKKMLDDRKEKMKKEKEDKKELEKQQKILDKIIE